jgi:hypothetical protein
MTLHRDVRLRGVNLELYRLYTKARAEYKGTLRPEIEVGRLNFQGAESGELVEASSSGRSLYLTGESRARTGSRPADSRT